jgi:hypothetical protein
MTEPKAKVISKVLLAVISLIVIIAVTLIVAGVHLSNPNLRKKAVEILGEKFHASVELKDFHVYLFPGARIEGSGLVLRHEGRTDVPPLISIGEFSAQAGLTGLLWKRKIGQISSKD